jgi:polyhydroxybutyrate depolymerase
MITKGFITVISAIALCLIAGCASPFTSRPDASATGSSGTTGTVWGSSTGGAAAGSGQAGTGGISAGSGGVSGTTTASISGTGGSGTVVAGSGGDIAGSGGGAGTESTTTPVEQSCPTNVLPPGEQTVQIQAGGRPRSFLLHVPANYTGTERVPLVIDWHGILNNPAFERQLSGWADLSEVEGFIVIYPEGIDTAFNLGICCTTSRDIDDIGFARAIVDAIKQKACINTNRIHSVGYSMGGGMSMYTACAMADIFASVAASAFDLIRDQDFHCAPSRPISVMTFRNTGDPICPYNGGDTYPPNGLPVIVNFRGAQKTFADWGAMDQCTGEPDPNGYGGCPTYKQCAPGVEVAFCTDKNETSGHGWMTASVAWEFLSKHPMDPNLP